MRSVSVRLCDLKHVTIPIGIVGENCHTIVKIDCTKAFQDYPGAVAEMVVLPPVGEAYPAVLSRDGDIIIWEVTNSDLVYEGFGEIQLQFVVDETVAESYIGRTKILRSIIATGEIPTAWENWLNDFTELKLAAEAAAESAEQDAADAETWARQAAVSGAEQVALVEAAGAAQLGAVNAAGTTQVGNVNTAGSTQVGNVNTAGAAQVAAIEDKGEETLESIPSDYTNLSNDVDDLKSAIDEHSSIVSTNLMGIDVQENLYPGAVDWSGEWTASNPSSISLSNELFDGYPVMYYSGTWRKYYKTIPIVSGKTYTFEAWMKHTTAGTAAIYAKDGDTQNPATLSVSSATYNNIPANVWTKLSLTFSCTASGNITPYIHSRSGNMYFAKYYLCEGNAFSLKQELNNKATLNDVTGIGDYKKYNFSVATSAGQYWNPVIEKPISIGTKVRMIFDSYSGSKLSYVRIDGKKSDDSYTNELCKISAPFVKGGYAEFVATENYVSLRVQYGRTETESNVTAAIYLETDSTLGLAHDMLGASMSQVFHVEKDGSGDFTSFVDAINAATQFMDSVVYVGEGTFDLLDELGSEYIKDAGSSKKGPVLKNRVHVYGTARTILKMDNKRSLYDTDAQYNAAKEYLSPINTGDYGCILEGVRIESTNVRYSIHDDRGWAGNTPYTNKFINCELVHKSGMYGDCIGGGLGENCEIEIRGCYFEGDTGVVRLAYYHANNHTDVTDAQGRLIVADNYFAGVGTFQLHKYGDSTKMSTAYVSNNSFGTAPSVTTATGAQDNMQMIAWNNEVRT